MTTEWTLYKPAENQNSSSLCHIDQFGKVLRMHGSVIAEMVGKGVCVCLCSFNDDHTPVHYHFLDGSATQHYLYSVFSGQLICMHRSWGRSLDDAIAYHSRGGTRKMGTFDSFVHDVNDGMFDINKMFNIA